MSPAEIGEVIKAVAMSKNRHRNLVVMLRTDRYFVDKEMLAEKIAGLAYVSASDRGGKDNLAVLKHKDCLNRMIEEVKDRMGTCSDGMKHLLASILDNALAHKTMLIGFVEYRLDMAEMKFVVDFVKSKFPETTFIFTSVNDLVISDVKNANILYLFDDNWYLQDCSEVTPDNPVRDVAWDGWSSLLNHCMSGVWQDRDEKRFSAIDPNSIQPSERLIYNMISARLHDETACDEQTE